ncbi:MAG: hypothetical protein ACLRR3_04455 [Eubacterium sp.]
MAKEVAKSEKPTAVATIADGKAVFQGLQTGLYLVEVRRCSCKWQSIPIYGIFDFSA